LLVYGDCCEDGLPTTSAISESINLRSGPLWKGFRHITQLWPNAALQQKILSGRSPRICRRAERIKCVISRSKWSTSWQQDQQ
jgi:hypothetical protein